MTSLQCISIRCNKNYAQNLEPENAVLKRRIPSIDLEKEFVRNCKVRETFFMNTIADDCNKLGNEIINAKTVNGFEARYDNLLQHNSVKNNYILLKYAQ